MDRQNNFDLLRLLAALSVIFSHAFLLAENSQDRDPLMILTGGQAILGLAGVFVFFTISGYLVTQSFEHTRPPLLFLAKRGLRIFPGLIACLLVCALAIGPLVTELPLAEYLARRQTWLFVLHNAVLDVEYNRLPGVAFAATNIGGIVNGPLWSLPCEALLYLMVFALGLCRLLTLGTTLVLLAIGIGAAWFDTAGETFGSALWLLGFFAAGMCCYRLRGHPRLIDGRWALLALVGLALSIPAHAFLLAFPLCGGYLVIYLALSSTSRSCRRRAGRSLLRSLHLRLADRAMRRLGERKAKRRGGRCSRSRSRSPCRPRSRRGTSSRSAAACARGRDGRWRWPALRRIEAQVGRGAAAPVPRSERSWPRRSGFRMNGAASAAARFITAATRNTACQLPVACASTLRERHQQRSGALRGVEQPGIGRGVLAP